VVSAYMLASTVNLPIYDKLSDIYGRKPVFILGTMVARELSEELRG
jgi:MFS family permease